MANGSSRQHAGDAMTLSASLAGISKEDEARCDQWASSGQVLRAVVAWRMYQGKGQVLSEMTGIPLKKLKRFIKTGSLDDRSRLILEAMS